MSRVLVTGASGFIGAALTPLLVQRGFQVRAAFRTLPDSACLGVEAVRVGDLGASTDWSSALVDVDVVVHLAGPAHGRTGFDEAIVGGTRALATQAEAAGVSRFVFVSSIKAVTSATRDVAVAEHHAPAPVEPYGRAKLQAEQGLMRVTGMECIILRPPLVFAPNAKANFLRLLRLADSGLPLPLNSVRNKRSLLALSAFNEAVWRVLSAPAPPSPVFHLAGSPALSSAEIVGCLREGVGRPPRIFGSRSLATLLPAGLTQSLAVDDTRFRETYGSTGYDGDVRQALSECARIWKGRR